MSRIVDFPDEWGTARPLDMLGGVLADHPDLAVGALLLEDGSKR